VTLTDRAGGRLVVALDELARGGLALELGPYEARVFLDVQQSDTLPGASEEIRSGAGDVAFPIVRPGAARQDAVLCRPIGVGARRRRSVRHRAGRMRR